MKKPTFSVCLVHADGTSECLYWGIPENDAQAEADRINAHLAARGIPTWVSSAVVTL